MENPRFKEGETVYINIHKTTGTVIRIRLHKTGFVYYIKIGDSFYHYNENDLKQLNDGKSKI